MSSIFLLVYPSNYSKQVATVINHLTARIGGTGPLTRGHASRVDILFLSNHNIHKSSCGHCFWASDPLNDRFYLNLSIKGSEAQKQWPHELL